MQARSQKFYQLLMTGVGLFLFAMAVMLNHYHPHNEGIANITRGSLFKRLGIEVSGQTGPSGLNYISPLPKAQPKTDKIADPTTDSAAHQASLPVMAPAGDGSNAEADNSNSDQDSTHSNNSQDNNGQRQSQTEKD